ncbi:uncharacterized protein LOC132798274 [Drosophila nasuta]|uniref:uncharacterized protein LOC132798274 n=1 Tax=Drosophila nasuta TaxID=42062 RepID=UPI00295F3B85|nr:uncharacterized protein LOC132798274 [Drosophila nasuta]
MDNDNNKPPDDEKQQPEQSSSVENVLQLLDGQVGETETDLPIELAPSLNSLQNALEHLNFSEAKALVEEMIESLLPDPGPLNEGSSSTLTSVAKPPIGYDDERLHRILHLLERYTRNLEVIEELMVKARDKADTSLQQTQNNELATQTMPLLHTRRCDTMRPQSDRRIQQQPVPQPQSQHSEIVPPCERRQHIITISGTNSSPFAARPLPRTFMGRICRTLGEFAGAFCLCLQVNRDCIFCLGFFIAFVISASFLTAFFYRTINLTTSPIRVPIDATPMSSSARDTVSLRSNGGYYYIYNSNRQHFV